MSVFNLWNFIVWKYWITFSFAKWYKKLNCFDKKVNVDWKKAFPPKVNCSWRCVGWCIRLLVTPDLSKSRSKLSSNVSWSHCSCGKQKSSSELITSSFLLDKTQHIFIGFIDCTGWRDFFVQIKEQAESTALLMTPRNMFLGVIAAAQSWNPLQNWSRLL